MGDSSDGLRLRDTLSGCVGAACLVAAGAPFDIVKVRLQTMSSMYTGPFDCARKIVSKEGLLALWKGAGPAFSSAVIENAVAFTANGFLRRLFMSNLNSADLPLGTEMMIGALGGIFSGTAICPAEVIKCRMQLAHAENRTGGVQYRGTLHAFTKILRLEGMGGLFAGWTPLLLRDVPFNALFFGGYRAYIKVIHSLTGESGRPISPLESFLAGGLAGMTAWAVVFPFDVIKSRMQVAGVTPNSSSTNTLRAIAQIVKRGGLKSLYKGASPAILRGFPANAALFGGQTAADRLLNKVGL